MSVDGTGQVYTTDPYKASLDPKWNTHYDLFLGRGDGITISVWNQKKIHKKEGGGFLGCVRIVASTIQRMKDTGCEYFKQMNGEGLVLTLFWLQINDLICVNRRPMTWKRFAVKSSSR